MFVALTVWVTKIAKRLGILTNEVLDGLSALTICRALDVLTLRELTGPNERLIVKDPTPGIPRVATPRGTCPTITDLHDTIDHMETRSLCTHQNSLKYQDTAVSKGKEVINGLSFYRMETDEISERYIAQCFVNGLEAFDGEINLAFDENLISNEFAVKLCLDYEVKKGTRLVKKELIVALKGELYFVKFIINPEEDDFIPIVTLGRSFLRLSRGIVDFGNGVITIYPELDPFEDDFEKTGKNSDDWNQLLDFNFDDVLKSREELSPFIYKMRKNNRNKKRAVETFNLFYHDVGPSASVGRHLTQEEAEKEELAIRISQRYALLEEERHVIETMAYNDKYKMILDEIWKDKVELDGKTVKEDEEAVKRIKGEALKEKEDLGAFIFPIRLEGKVNENALADTGWDINTMPY
ncbi:hypothetical protein Tco_0652008 [Tanacetum coccineum]|uniref:Uncharacterized protein n=1 Tax=Tanacetum coccineum TaxID=301880 RepID=A0ABQ4WWD7_9ASTR